MKLTTITIVLFALIGKILATGIVIRTSKPTESSELLIDATVKILASCYGNNGSTIGLYGNLAETFIETIWARTLIPILLINDTDCANRPRFHRRKINVFVIIATNRRQVVRGLKNIFCSRWFNRSASFLIVDWSPTEKYGCFRIAEIFNSVWLNKIFNANVLCLHPTKGRMLFGYNPHTNQAPTPWQLTETLKFQNGQRLSVFERQYEQKEVCKSLDFDKTHDLSGSWIIFCLNQNRTREKVQIKEMTKSSIPKKYQKSYLFTKTIFNIFMTFIHQLNTDYRTIIRKDCHNAIEGIAVHPVNFENEINIDVTYPHMRLGISLATNFEGNKSQLRKILTVVDVYSQFGTCLVLLVTLIFFKFVVGQALIPAILNIVRITCNTGFENVPQNSALRIYISGVLLFVVTMQGIFTGNLSSLLTREVPVEHAKTIQDILDRNYTIYASQTYKHVFADPMYKGRVVLLESFGVTCMEYLLRDPSGACVALTHMILDCAKEYNIYTNGDIIFNQYLSFITEYDWAFVKRFNKLLVTMVEADIVDMFYFRLIRNRVDYIEPVDNNAKVMTLNDLGFAFVILGIGLVCATVSFVVEVSIKRIRLAIAKIRRRLSNCFRSIKKLKFRS